MGSPRKKTIEILVKEDFISEPTQIIIPEASKQENITPDENIIPDVFEYDNNNSPCIDDWGDINNTSNNIDDEGFTIVTKNKRGGRRDNRYEDKMGRYYRRNDY